MSSFSSIRDETSLSSCNIDFSSASCVTNLHSSSIDSAWMMIPVNVNGIVGEEEWSDATSVHVMSGVSINFHYYLYVKNDENWMYMCVDVVGDGNQEDNDYCFIAFDTGHDEIFTHESEEAWVAYCWSNEETLFADNGRNETGMIAAEGFAESSNAVKIPMSLGDLNAYPGYTAGFDIEIVDGRNSLFLIGLQTVIGKMQAHGEILC